MDTPTGTPLPRIAKTTLVDEVIAVMRKMLRENAWPPGTKLPSEQELGRQLGVGRSTIREALRVLGHLGIVESRSGLGTYVLDHGLPDGRLDLLETPEALYALYDFRHMLEVPAARLAAERRTADQLNAIVTTWRNCGRAAEKHNPIEFARLDYRFHLSIMQASRNHFLAQAYRGLEDTFVTYVNLILGLDPPHSMRHFHDGVILAIKRGDADAAARAVNENFRETDARLRLLSNRAGPPPHAPTAARRAR